MKRQCFVFMIATLLLFLQCFVNPPTKAIAKKFCNKRLCTPVIRLMITTEKHKREAVGHKYWKKPGNRNIVFYK
jgi:hypothetical protein